MDNSSVSGQRKTSLRGLRKQQKRAALLFALPAIAGFLVWYAGPIIASFILSLTEYDILSAPSFSGLANYENMFFRDPLFWESLKVTFYFSIGRVPLILGVAFIIALLMDRKLRGLAFFRTVFYIPSIIPLVAASILWIWLFNPEFGLFNLVLNSFRLPSLSWIHSEEQVIPSLILMSVWLGLGQPMIIFLAGLQDVPQHLYEAVEIDGGNWVHKLRHITIPMISPVFLFNFVMQIIFSFQIFTQVFIMTGGGPVNSSLVYVYYIYRNAFASFEMGYASALSWILFLIIGVITLLIFRFSRSFIYYEA